jgi:hypothetical protein
MGEHSARREGILGGFVIEVCYIKDNRLSSALNVVHLHSFYVDKSKYVYNKPFVDNMCKFKINLETTLMIKNINGETTNA